MQAHRTAAEMERPAAAFSLRAESTRWKYTFQGMPPSIRSTK